MRVAVVTIAHGRHRHLALQQQGLGRSTRLPDEHVIVAMDDPSLEERVAPTSIARHVVHVPRVDGGLPLAQARNLGARCALARGATLLVFLDVDCIPSPDLVAAYEDAATDLATSRDLLCGPVTYLEPPPAEGYDLEMLPELWSPHPARPAPPAGTVQRSSRDHELFWSLSFAVTAETWRVNGGFDESYVGYGGEDTDFAFTARAAGTAIGWVGSARAFHQHHLVSAPPVEHVVDIVRNASIFHDRWGVWPMTGWLDAFEERGLVRRAAGGAYEVVA